jgi:peptide/nickel transport system permease protein
MSQPSTTLDNPTLALERARRAGDGWWGRIWYNLRHDSGVIIGSSVLLALILVAVFAPVVAPYNPIDRHPAGALKPPSATHIFGTDQLGRDIFSRVVFGTRISLVVGLIAVTIGLIFGSGIGLISGYYSGWIDVVLMRLMEILLAFPFLLLALTIVFILGPNLINVMIALGISSIPDYARLVRGSVLSAREHVYVDAARVVGCRDRTIMWRHILPNVIPPVLVVSTLNVARAIISAASLSFLGMGAQPPTPEWGMMLADGRNVIRQAWWVATFPGLAIMFTVLAINLLGDGLRDVLDPRVRKK